ncbi:MAG: site-specific DNA-methyltransferase, partial [Candidatus Micrarchaeaceae archaeon]
QDADYLYTVKYKNSTWASMLENRLRLAMDLLNDKGSIFVRCDYNGNWIVRPLMDEVFGRENFRNEIIIKRMTKLGGTTGSLDVAVDSLFLFSKSESILLKPIRRDRICKYCKQPKQPDWVPLEAPGEGRNDLIIIERRKFYARQNSHWTFKQELIDGLFKKRLVRVNKNRSYIDKFGNRVQGMPEYLQYPFQEIDNDWADIPGYSRNWEFQTENSEQLLQRVIESTSNEGDLVMDFFLGSGTTTAVAHKLKRKWIGIEMGEHFYSVVLPRMKNVLAYDKSGISKKVKEYQSGGFFKYYELEQYEDTLHNIDFPQKEKGQKLFEFLPESAKTEYLMKYMLRFETEGSPSLLDIKQFENPFEYKLKIISSGKGEEIVNVDLVETFNYLIGLKINKYKFLQENSRKYVFVFGERNNRKTAIIWRPTKNIDMEKDKEVIDNAISGHNPEEIFVNGDSYIKGYKVIESEFKTLMGV